MNINANHEASGNRSASPCVNVCELNDAGTMCMGCLRTVDEIAYWSGTDDDGRNAILLAINERRKASQS